MRLLFILLSGCSTLHSQNKDVEILSTPTTECPLTIRVDVSCENYEESRYKIFDANNVVRSIILSPGEEATVYISPGRFVIERVSFAASGFVFPNGLKREKTTTSNLCEEKFTNQLFCD